MTGSPLIRSRWYDNFTGTTNSCILSETVRVWSSTGSGHVCPLRPHAPSPGGVQSDRAGWKGEPCPDSFDGPSPTLRVWGFVSDPGDGLRRRSGRSLPGAGTLGHQRPVLTPSDTGGWGLVPRILSLHELLPVSSFPWGPSVDLLFFRGGLSTDLLPSRGVPSVDPLPSRGRLSADPLSRGVPSVDPLPSRGGHPPTVHSDIGPS